MISLGSNNVGNLNQSMIVKNNVFRTCAGWLFSGPVKGGGFIIFDDNVIQSGLNADQKHLGIIRCSGMDAAPVTVPGFGAQKVVIYVRRNTGDSGTQTAVFCKSDAASHVLSLICEGNSFFVDPTAGAGWHLVETANLPMLRIDILNNDLNGTTNTGRLLNHRQLVQHAEAAAHPRQPGLQADDHDGPARDGPAVHHADQRGRHRQVQGARRATTSTSANAYYVEMTQGISSNELFGPTVGPTTASDRDDPRHDDGRPGDHHAIWRQRRLEHPVRVLGHDRLGHRHRRLLRFAVTELAHEQPQERLPQRRGHAHRRRRPGPEVLRADVDPGMCKKLVEIGFGWDGEREAWVRRIPGIEQVEAFALHAMGRRHFDAP